MGLWMMGGGGWQPPFNRTFFNVVLAEFLELAGKDKESRLTLYLVDGSQLDIRSIEALSDLFLTVKAGPRNEGDELSLHLLPYSTIYRIEVTRAPDGESRKLGFRWASLADKSKPPRKNALKGVFQSLSERKTPIEGTVAPTSGDL
jgi:hypothetical protein